MDLEAATKILKDVGQHHLLKGWDALDKRGQAQVLEQLKRFDPKTLKNQQSMLRSRSHPIKQNLEPFGDFATSGNEADRRLGRSLMADGKVGCIVVAGGQGTRLGHQGPKGTYPVTPVEKKSLFQLTVERTLAASHWVNSPLFMAIMTSQQNDHDTRNFFAGNRCFGIEVSRLNFFAQKGLPLLDDDGNMFLKAPGEIAFGPEGNGPALTEFYHQGIWEQWRMLGIRHVVFIQIDNVLADPFDAELVGYHFRSGADVTLKACLRQDPNEKVGVITRQGNTMRVIEYSELSEQEQHATDSHGRLKHPCANLSMFCFSMDFIERVAEAEDMPLHIAHKKSQLLDDNAIQKEIMAWKFERFIFDVLQHARQPEVLIYPREECFAPLKNASGADSLSTVQEALIARDRRQFFATTGVEPLAGQPLELDPQFYYPTQQFLHHCQQGTVKGEGYIRACEGVNC